MKTIIYLLFIYLFIGEQIVPLTDFQTSSKGEAVPGLFLFENFKFKI